ncbi:hypothetical protein GX51_06124 [Blastomyces parvus]|uniref:Uncharacterized protein n=1 Tax=Blastomyces parvus TaxID=2060905 RepID=A0A2B7WTA6_9EURO|nr:hypothetical protein GX51_06124 [Blastomyces parvus]
MTAPQTREFPDGYFGDRDVRIILRFNSNHIPGKPGRRHIVLITTFFEEKVGRSYSDDDDYVHLPSGIFESNAKCWMILDLSVKRRKTLDNLPIFCYRVRTSNDGASVQFTRVNFALARHYSNIFPWGRFLGSSDTSDDSRGDEEEDSSAIPQPTDPKRPLELPKVASPTNRTDIEESVQPIQAVDHDESAKDPEPTAPVDVNEPTRELEPTKAADGVKPTHQVEPSNTARTNNPCGVSEKKQEQGNESKDDDSRKGAESSEQGVLTLQRVRTVELLIYARESQQQVVVAPQSSVGGSQEQSNNQFSHSKPFTAQAAENQPAQPQNPPEQLSEQPITVGKAALTAADDSCPKESESGWLSWLWKVVRTLFFL